MEKITKRSTARPLILMGAGRKYLRGLALEIFHKGKAKKIKAGMVLHCIGQPIINAVKMPSESFLRLSGVHRSPWGLFHALKALGAFRGDIAVPFLVLHMDKFKKETVRGIQSHNLRERKSHSNPDIEYERSSANYELHGRNPGTIGKKRMGDMVGYRRDARLWHKNTVHSYFI